MPFDYLSIGKGKKRLACKECKSILLIVDYQDLKKPKKGKREKGFFGTCLVCKKQNRITSGSPQ